jgi:hypothetical protein
MCGKIPVRDKTGAGSEQPFSGRSEYTMKEPGSNASSSVHTHHPCLHCVHFIEHWKCKAFLTMIPHAIRNGQHDHRTPFPGDHGIMYEPDETARHMDRLYASLKRKESAERPDFRRQK